MWLGMREARRSSGCAQQLLGLRQDSDSPRSADQVVEKGHDLMEALSQIPIATLMGIDEAFVLLDSGLGAIFSAGLARRAAMERNKKLGKEIDASPKKQDAKCKVKTTATKVKHAALLKRVVERSQETLKKHAAQATTMELLNNLVASEKFKKISVDRLGRWGRRAEATNVATPESRCSVAVGDDRGGVVLPMDPDFWSWVEANLKLDPDRLGSIEADGKWRAKLQHQMLCWEAQQADKLEPAGVRNTPQQEDDEFRCLEKESLDDECDDACGDAAHFVESLEKCIADVASCTTLTTVASTSSLNTGQSSPTNVVPQNSPCRAANSIMVMLPTVSSPAVSMSSQVGTSDTHLPPSSSELLAGQIGRVPNLSTAFTNAGKMMFGLSHYGSVNRCRRSKPPPDCKKASVDQPFAAKTFSSTTFSSKQAGRETDVAATMGPLSVRERLPLLPTADALPKIPYSARARMVGAASDSASAPARADKWMSRLASLGQTRDLVAGSGLRQPPRFAEPHREIQSTDIGKTPEHMYVRRCAAMGLVPHPAVWRDFVDSGDIDASNRALRDDDVLAIVQTTASVVSEEQPLLSLNLSQNLVTDFGLKEIARFMLAEPCINSPFVALSALNLSGNTMLSFRAIGAMDGFASALASLPALSRLDLSGVALHAQLILLCSAIEKCKSLEELSLANCGIGRTDQSECVVVAGLLGCKPSTGWAGLCQADFSRNFFGHSSFAVAATALRHARLSRLSFAHNASSMTWLVAGKEIRFHPMQLLFEGLQFNRTLTSLWLSDCSLGPDSAFVLEEAAQSHPCLNSIDLSDNPLGDIGLRSVIRLLLALENEIHTFNVEGHREADAMAHIVKFRLTQPSGIYRLNLRYPHDRACLRQLLKHAAKVRSGVLRHFKFDSKCGKPAIERDGSTQNWIVPTSGIFSFSFQPPLSSSLHNYMAYATDRSRTDASSDVDVARSTQLQARASTLFDDPGKSRKTFLVGGGSSTLIVGSHEANFQQRRSSRTSILPLVGASVKAGKESAFHLLQQLGTPGKLDNKLDQSYSVNWTEVDRLFSDTRLRVSALRFAIIRAMFLSFVTREQQLRFIHACSKDMAFNFVQVSQFCKDRPEVTTQIVSSLFASVSGRPSQLMLLGSLSASVSPIIAKEVSHCLWLQEGNLSGRYSLDLSKPADYWVVENCFLVNAWESEISRVLQNPDVSQRGNCEMLRNEVYSETPFLYSRDWALPNHGLLKFDYSSIRRPPLAIAAMPEASEVHRYLQRITANPEVKLRALRAVSVHLYMSAHQFKALLLCFPPGVFRRDFFCMFHTRVVDVSRFLGPDLLYNSSIIDQEDRQALLQRVGALHLLNPLHPEGVRFRCNLAVYEERRIVEFLVQLSTEEPGGKVLGATGVHISDDCISFRPVPASWADKGVPRDEGTIVCCYEATTINMNWRMSLAEKYCIGCFNHG